MNGVELYWFSGTGNSLHIAQEIQKRIPEVTLIPIIKFLAEDEIKTNAEVVGIIFPLYLTTIPKPVDEFFKKLDISSAKYAFSVITRIGTFSVANVYIDKLLKKRGMSLDASFMLNMANNSPAGLKPFADQNWIDDISNEKIRALEDKVQVELELIADYIMRREKVHANGTMSLLSYLLEPIMTKLTQDKGTEIPFTVDINCSQCGICESVCPSGKIKIVDGKTTWDTLVPCYYCYACFNFCPTQAILIGKKYMLKNGRYHHPDIDYEEVSAQKKLKA